MQRHDRLARFARVVERPAEDIDLDVAALLLGDWDDAAADDAVARVARGRGQLDRLAARAQTRARTDGQPWSGARAISHVLFDEDGFAGNQAAYYDPRNSFLGDVLVRRTGIPISLSVVYLEVARRIGVRAAGVALPGHFVVRVDGDAIDDGPGRALILDPFHGGAVLGPGELAALAARSAGADATAPDLSPATTPQVLTRMLYNLAGIYGRDGDLFRSLEVLERLAILAPDSAKLATDLSALRARADDLN